MYVSQIRIQGFSSFSDSGWIPLVPGLNMVIGANNSGKSAFLQALSPLCPLNKHRDEVRFLEGNLLPQIISLDLSTTTDEFRQRLAQCNIAVTPGNGPTVAAADDLIKLFSKNREMPLKVESRDGSQIFSRCPTFEHHLEGNNPYSHNISLQSGELFIQNVSTGLEDTIISAYTHENSSAFFNFAAQRLNIARVGFSRQNKLSFDAANLPGVLAFLSGNSPHKMREIESRVREVIPSVAQITVDPTSNGYEVLVWPHMSIPRRELAFSLDNCGTGVSQVIAIFTAIITSENNIIVVDEINSFLHPEATKRLIGILASEYVTNQYIISSHSSDAISHPSVDQMIIVEREKFDSKVRVIPERDLSQISGALRSLGISMSDVLGADGILWVEGVTEEIAFTNLYQKEVGNLPDGVRLSAVASTGDFVKRGASKKSVVELYRRVTTSVAPMSLGQRFLLDRERLGDDAVHKMEIETDNRLRFLPRRCLECYAIDPEVISGVLSDELGEDFTSEQVIVLISTLANDRSLGGASFFDGDLTNEDWLKRVDGATLLKLLFEQISETRLEFRKTHHTPIILSRISAEKLAPLSALLKQCVGEITGSP